MLIMLTVMTRGTRRHLGICGYCRESNTPHFHQLSLPDGDVIPDEDHDDDVAPDPHHHRYHELNDFKYDIFS